MTPLVRFALEGLTPRSHSFSVVQSMNLSHTALLVATLVLTGGCRDVDESKAKHRTDQIESFRDASMKPDLHELELSNQEQTEELLTLIAAHDRGVLIYFHIHDKDYRYSDFSAWVRRSNEGFEYNLSGHGTAPTHHVFSHSEDLLIRIGSDNSRYSPLDVMHYAAYVDQDTDHD